MAEHNRSEMSAGPTRTGLAHEHRRHGAEDGRTVYTPTAIAHRVPSWRKHLLA